MMPWLFPLQKVSHEKTRGRFQLRAVKGREGETSDPF